MVHKDVPTLIPDHRHRTRENRSKEPDGIKRDRLKDELKGEN